MLTHLEVQVWYILPALRKHLALSLKKEGLKQKNIASILGITEAAVSQYAKDKRGMISLDKEIQKEILDAAKRIANSPERARLEVQRLLSKVKDSRFICSICHMHTNSPENCDICYRG